MLFFWGDASFPAFDSDDPEYLKWKSELKQKIQEARVVQNSHKRKSTISIDQMLKRGYTSDEMDRGEGMKFHPMDGNPFDDLVYDDEKKVYYAIGYFGTYDLPRIGDGQDRLPGALYLPHWTHDPFTGYLL